MLKFKDVIEACPVEFNKAVKELEMPPRQTIKKWNLLNSKKYKVKDSVRADRIIV